MLKHVHSSTTSLFRCGKPIAKDSLSLNSTISLSSGSNSANLELASSRSSSTCSLHDSLSLTGSPQKPQVKKVSLTISVTAVTARCCLLLTMFGNSNKKKQTTPSVLPPLRFSPYLSLTAGESKSVVCTLTISRNYVVNTSSELVR